MKASLLAASLVATGALARDVPSNIQSLYDSIRDKGECSNVLKTGFRSSNKGPNGVSYCGDHLQSDGILYIQGTSRNLTNMNIACDGILSEVIGGCEPAQGIKHRTRFRDELRKYDWELPDLDPYVHGWVVLGNENGDPEFDPRSVGIQPLSVVAVVCDGKMFYGVWGDVNDDDGPGMVGEASLTIGKACYGKHVNGNKAHKPEDVLYIAFKGSEAVPGAAGANWTAKSFEDFEASLSELGDKLVQGINATC